MGRVFIEHEGGSMALPEGETLIGRDVACGLRFNDPALSRRQCRVVVREGRAIVEDLGSRNGTRVNGARIERPRALRDGDVIEIGRRRLRIHVVEDDAAEPAPRETQPTLQALVAGDVADTDWRCAACGGPLGERDARCPQCGRPRPAGHPASPTVEFRSPEAERRRFPRAAVRVPVLYASDSLALETESYDLGPGGLFIASGLLDPPGTPCRLTLLPDGGPAIVCAARVRHARSARLPGGAPPGMGIELVGLDARGRAFLAERARLAGG